MDLSRRRYLYNRCIADESLAPEDERNVDVDRHRGRVRGQVWVERLAARILLSETPTCTLFTGLPGSGKSTELRRLQTHLLKPEQGPWLTVLIDAKDSLDLTSPLDIPDLLAMIVHETEREVLQWEGVAPEQALQDGYLVRLWTWLTQTDVEFSKAEYAIPGGPMLVAEMKTRPSLRQRLRQTVATHLGAFLQGVNDALAELSARVVNRGYAGLVIIVDSLEKLRGIDENFDRVLGSAIQMFGAGAPYLRLPVHCIYTVPPALFTRVHNIDFMPVVKLREQSGGLSPDGLAVLRELVRRRVSDSELSDILGPGYEQCVHRIFELSGGYPREIVRLLRELIAMPSYPVREDDFARLLAEVRASYRNLISASAYGWLAEVSRTHQLALRDDEHRRLADDIISNNGLLYYWNGDSWWGLHPAVASIDGVRVA